VQSCADRVYDIGAAIGDEEATRALAGGQVARCSQSGDGQATLERERACLVDGHVGRLAAHTQNVQLVREQRDTAHCHVRQRDLEIVNQSCAYTDDSHSVPPTELTKLTRLVVWSSGRTSVFRRRTFAVLRSTCS